MIRPERFLRKTEVETEAQRVLDQYRRKNNGSLKLPIEPDLIGEVLFQLTFEWDVIPEVDTNGQRMVILAGLYPRSRRVVMNETYVGLYEEKRGLERFTQAHEVGHWVLHIDHSQLADTTLALFADDIFQTQNVPNEAIICRDGDNTWIERQANWFAAALIMPREIVLEAIAPRNARDWDVRYELADYFGVNITALNNRLTELGIGDIDEMGKLYRSPAERSGQMRLQ